MDDNIAIFLVLIVSIAAAVTLVLSSVWMRRNRLMAAGAQPGEYVAHLAAENELLREQVHRLEQQLGIVDRLSADGIERASRETVR
jgi:hypothetical protein